MFDTKKINMVALKTDLVKNATVVVVSRLLKYMLVDNRKGELFNQEFVYSLVFLLLGFVAYHVAVTTNVDMD